MLEEVEVSDAPTEHVEHWKAPDIAESALKYTALTFRKIFDSNDKKNVQQQLKGVIHTMRAVTKGQTRANAEAFKWYLSLNINFCKSTSSGVNTDLAVTFHSEAFKSIDTHEFNYLFHVEYKQIVQQIDKFQRNGSGWILNHLEHLDVGICFW